MGMGDSEGLGDPEAKGALLKLAHARHDTSSTDREGTIPLLLRHPQVIIDCHDSGRQAIILITFDLKKPPRLGEIDAQTGRNFLGTQPLGHLDSKTRLACLGLPTRFVALSDGAIDHHGILVCLPLQHRGPLLSLQLEVPLRLQLRQEFASPLTSHGIPLQ